jgi:hypothetical protein
MPCAAKAPNTKKDFWFFSSEKNETNKINICVYTVDFSEGVLWTIVNTLA